MVPPPLGRGRGGGDAGSLLPGVLPPQFGALGRDPGQTRRVLNHLNHTPPHPPHPTQSPSSLSPHLPTPPLPSPLSPILPPPPLPPSTPPHTHTHTHSEAGRRVRAVSLHRFYGQDEHGIARFQKVPSPHRPTTLSLEQTSSFIKDTRELFASGPRSEPIETAIRINTTDTSWSHRVLSTRAPHSLQP